MTMSNAFVWFHNDSQDSDRTETFYAELLGWERSDGPGGMSFLAGAAGPFAEVRAAAGKRPQGWVPYAEVDDVDVATQKALELGGRVVADRMTGPAGDFSIVRDPGGATVALWQKA
jgi:uncharacterized protein